LVVVDIAPVNYADRFTAYAKALLAPEVLSAETRAEVQRRLVTWLPDAAVAPFLMQNLVIRNDRFDWRVNVTAILASVTELSGFPTLLQDLRFPRPILVIAGKRSDYLSVNDAVHFQPMFPALHFETVPGAGHWVHSDQPEACCNAVMRFLGPQASAPAS
ncbi:MAG: hypothetical protein IPK16_30245, partial [Anaerolineales bacterium]|nr:hypothetical protein [Anaerolineales bacterium]